MRTSPCKGKNPEDGCGQPMIWATKSQDGRAWPFDAEPVTGGRWALRETDETDRFDNPVIEAEHVGEGYNGPTYQPHFVSCVNADKHRKPRT